MDEFEFLNKEEILRVEDAIADAETFTSGEIRVHIDEYCDNDLMGKAAKRFEELEMDMTELRNGVLFYIAYKDRKFAIIGDSGINEKVPEGFWDSVRETLEENFKKGDFSAGLCEGIKICGKKLSELFPFQEGDINELPNEVTFGK